MFDVKVSNKYSPAASRAPHGGKRWDPECEPKPKARSPGRYRDKWAELSPGVSFELPIQVQSFGHHTYSGAFPEATAGSAQLLTLVSLIR